MKRLLVGTLLLCSLLCASAFATTIIGLAPDETGDNFGFIIYGNGVFIGGGGGTPFFNNIEPHPPGSELFFGSGDLFMSGGFIRSGPNSSDLLFDVGTLFITTITLPTNGKDFRAPVNVSFDLTATLLTTGEMIDVSGEANGYIQFHLVDGNYIADPFVQVPEPGTLGLLGMGLLGIATRVRHKLLHQS